MRSEAVMCPSCGAQGMLVFHEERNIPIHSCVLLPTQAEALRFPRGDIKLGLCKGCGFISNLAFDPSMQDYSAPYEDQQCFSPTFDAFAQDLADRLIRKHDLHKKDILEIGCGKGDFLALLCEMGQNRGVGIDPSYVNGRIHGDAAGRLTFIKDYYSERYSNYKGDLVICRHTLEHIHDTMGFVAAIRNAIRQPSAVFFEVPDVTRILCELAFWDIYYEHCSYFSPGSLARLFRSCGFEVDDLSRGFDDQYLLIEARPMEGASAERHELEERPSQMGRNVEHFSAGCRRKIDEWRDLLHQAHVDGKRTAIWGSGSKCVSFLATLGIAEELGCVVDINPHRQSRFLPGSGKKVMDPGFLKEYKPDLTIVMNPVYRDEICHMLDDMQVDTEVVSV